MTCPYPTLNVRAPYAVVDLSAFDANAADLVRRAAGVPIRVASKSIRCRALIGRALRRDGFAGVMCYALAEALWLHAAGVSDDLFVAYPTSDHTALEALAADPVALQAITVTVDSIAGVDFLASVVPPGTALRVAVDVDASLRLRLAGRELHVGARRSPLRSAAEVSMVVRAAQARGFAVVGLLFYDAQIAGVPDSGPVIKELKRRSHASLLQRRGSIVATVRAITKLEFVNGGGTGSLHLTGQDPAITELAAGSGLYGPTLFDGYDDFTLRPAAVFASPVVRRPAAGMVTVFAGGYVASGEPGRSRVPRPVYPLGLRLTRMEAAGEVQTPLRGHAADSLRIGDLVWFRHAKAGEMCERFDELHLIGSDAAVAPVPTYRGEGKNFG